MATGGADTGVPARDTFLDLTELKHTIFHKRMWMYRTIIAFFHYIHLIQAGNEIPLIDRGCFTNAFLVFQASTTEDSKLSCHHYSFWTCYPTA